jgi:hypothetical protein
MISLGQAHETALTLEKAGATHVFWVSIAQNLELAKLVVAFVAEVLRVGFNLASDVERDMIGWTCLEQVKAEPCEFEPELQEFLQKGEDYVDGEEMVRRAKEQGVLSGLRHAEAMLRNQERIPVEWRKFVLVFPEVWQSPNDYRGVWILCWIEGRWRLGRRWLDRRFFSFSLLPFRLVRPRSLTGSADKYQKKSMDA